MLTSLFHRLLTCLLASVPYLFPSLFVSLSLLDCAQFLCVFLRVFFRSLASLLFVFLSIALLSKHLRTVRTIAPMKLRKTFS